MALVVLIVCFIFYYYYFIYQKSDEKEIVLSNTHESNIDENLSSNKDIYVDIKGFVNKPGVYSFSLLDNARINDLIIKAGGLMKEADTSTINLSKKLEDEMTVIIYSKSEVTNFVKTQDELNRKLGEGTLMRSAELKKDKQ